MTRVRRSRLAFALLAIVACNGAIGAPEPAPAMDAPRADQDPPPSATQRRVLIARKRASSGMPAEMQPAGTAGGDAATIGPAQPEVRFTPEQVLGYARYIAPALIGRVLSDAEQTELQALPNEALATMLDAWGSEEGFAESARTMMEVHLASSGQRDGVDHGLPGYLVRHVVKHDRPWSEVLTSDSCYDADDQPIECDSGAPYTAGILTTRGFLAANEGRFNLRRSITTMATFACRDYPLEDTLQPRIEKARLITMFQAETAEQQMEAAAAGGFGNGLECYLCHGQFSLHAQLFVRFDRQGVWREDADGQQNPAAQLGESFNGTMRSHMIDPAEAALESSSVFGSEVANLAQAARVISAHPVFLECTARNLLDHGLRLDRKQGVDPALLAAIRERVVASSVDPTLRELLVATFSHPEVVRAAVAELAADPVATEETP